MNPRRATIDVTVSATNRANIHLLELLLRIWSVRNMSYPGSDA